jgi:uncharacterized protein
LRVVRRDGGVRIYAPHEHALGPTDVAGRDARIDALADVVVGIYAPLTASSLSFYLRRLRYAVPQWHAHLGRVMQRAKERLARARVDGVDWYWPASEEPRRKSAPEHVRLLTPFDPVVHDRARFERLWGWVYRFEAYTPVAKRKLGYYALPLLWRDRVIGWGNASVESGALDVRIGYVGSRAPREAAFRRELDAEIERLRGFLGARS